PYVAPNDKVERPGTGERRKRRAQPRAATIWPIPATLLGSACGEPRQALDFIRPGIRGPGMPESLLHTRRLFRRSPSVAVAFDPFSSRLRLPLIAAPMLRISGVELTAAACINGVIGSFPTVNAREPDELDSWLTQIAERCARAERPTAPVCPNVLMRTDPAKLDADVDVLVRHRVEMVLASVGSPAKYVRKFHDVGCFIWADVGSMRHVERALEAGVDGLVLLSAGAGGQTGWANGLSFVRAVRKFYDGPLVLAGGISDGYALLAARVLGCELGLMGTRFIATEEAMAVTGYKDMLVNSSID